MRLQFFSIVGRNTLRSFVHWYKVNLRFRGTWGVGTIVFLGFIIFLAITTANTIMFGSPHTFSPSQNAKMERNKESCEHTGQGKVYITDDQGAVCRWKDLNPITSCCRDYSVTKLQIFSCENCNKTIACCSVYEFCVSCCMDPAKQDLRNDILESVDTKNREFEDPTMLSAFDYCRAICRTSSKSIHSHNQYRNDDKYCYTLNAPPLQNKTDGDGNMNRIKIAENVQTNEPVQEIEIEKQTKHTTHYSRSSSRMNVGDGERIESKKVFGFGIFTSESSSMDLAHWLRILMLSFLVIFVSMDVNQD